MAELAPRRPWTSAQTRDQFSAIAWLRWRIVLNSFRRKGGIGELVGHIVIYILFASITVLLVAGAGVGAYAFAHSGHLNFLSWLLWAIFILCQLLNIQLGQPGTTFDPTQLIRFPLRGSTYVLIRLFFGLLSPANVVGTLMSLATAVGFAIAFPSLWLFAVLGMAIFAATNVLFSRMAFAWIDRWLSTRRAREIFTGLVFAGSLGIQWANFNFNPAYNHGNHQHAVAQQRIHLAASLYQRAHPVLGALPPELTASSLIAIHRSALLTFLVDSLGCAVYAAFFLAIFALRMRTEFRGENLSDSAGGALRVVERASAPESAHTISPGVLSPAGSSSSLRDTPIIFTLLGKEFLYIRRHMGILYGLIMPVFLVLIFASKFASRSNSLWIFPAAVAYTLLAIGPLSYNAFGFEGAGSQLYFLAPVRMRDILLAKNILQGLMGMVEVLAIFGIITYIAGMPSLGTSIAALLWAVGTVAINNIFGNRRSFTTPKKIDPQRMANKQASQVSALISLGIMAACSSIAAGIFALCFWMHKEWILLPASAIFAAMGVLAYRESLRSIDQFALDHREPLFAEVCKQT